MDHYFPLGHHGGFGPDRTPEEVAFDDYLAGLKHSADFNPAPGGVEVQCPYRAVSSAIDFVDEASEDPFFLWLSFPEPHNPYQAPEPYFSLFPPETLPPTLSDASALAMKGFKYQWLRHIGETAFPDYAEQLPRARSNYFGMLRLIDDQVRRFVEHLDARGLRENTILFFLSDHGDYVGEYGLVRKGAELPEVLVRIPFQVCGPGIQASAGPHLAHISIVDILPTICEATGTDMPPGVQGRSLWPMLTGADWPREEFASAYAEQGFGGLHYTADDDFDPCEDGLNATVSFDELNGWSQSGNLRMLRRDDWKLLFDMQGRGQLYNLAQDPVELNNLYGDPAYAAIQERAAGRICWPGPCAPRTPCRIRAVATVSSPTRATTGPPTASHDQVQPRLCLFDLTACRQYAQGIIAARRRSKPPWQPKPPFWNPSTYEWQGWKAPCRILPQRKTSAIFAANYAARLVHCAAHCRAISARWAAR